MVDEIERLTAVVEALERERQAEAVHYVNLTMEDESALSVARSETNIALAACQKTAPLAHICRGLIGHPCDVCGKPDHEPA